jgi:hypothetical protein
MENNNTENNNTENNNIEQNNISFFLEDEPFENLEDNEAAIGQMMFDFDMNTFDDQKDLMYFIKKNMYNGNDEMYYNEEYKIKDLMKICQYYGIAKNIKSSKCKKSDIVSTIVYYENCAENYAIVEQRHRMWAYMTELLEDPKMKSFLLW